MTKMCTNAHSDKTVTSDALNLIHVRIQSASSLADLQTLSQRIPALHIQIIQQGHGAAKLGQVVSAISIAITRRLIQLAEAKLGTPPVPYAWMVAGSQAREEQTSHSDQDTALIIDNRMQVKHDVWFQALASFVSDGLDRCGFVYCPGDVMATNPAWRQTQNGWRDHFHHWVHQPRKRGLMYSSIFFDLRAVYGTASLWNELHREILTQTKGNSLFIAHMASISLHHQPPLGLFGRLKTGTGNHQGVVDIKHGGIIPIVDMARLFALERGIEAVNTRIRLQLLSGTQSLSESGAAQLLEAFDCLSNLRAAHQMQQLRTDKAADSDLIIKQLPTETRKQLKASFQVIHSMQKTLASRLGDGLLDE